MRSNLDCRAQELTRLVAPEPRGAAGDYCRGLLPSREACDEQGLASRVCDAVSRVAEVARALVAAACARTAVWLHRMDRL